MTRFSVGDRSRRYSICNLEQHTPLARMLLFKRRFLEAIRGGEKTQTVRLWPRRMMRPGQRSYIPGAGYIRIDTVEQVRLEELTDDDARPDGFGTADELRAELTALYGEKLADGHQAFRVTFHLLPPEEQRKEVKAEG